MMLKNFFLALSTSPGLRRWMETSPVARRLSRRFIAGNSLEDALEVARALAGDGLLAALDPLGENVTTAAEAERAAEGALRTVREAAALEAGATVSVKLTQLGLDLSREMAGENLNALAREAGRLGARVEVDMESSKYTQVTLELLENAHAAGPVRAVLQAYLHRTPADVDRANELRMPVRLCKGAYNEPASVAIVSKFDVDRAYRELSERLLEHGTYPAFATHDPAMIDPLIALGPNPATFEFQMLYGIRRDLQQQVAADGWRLRLYVPYGEAWYPYFMRRLAERPANVWFVARGLWR